MNRWRSSLQLSQLSFEFCHPFKSDILRFALAVEFRRSGEQLCAEISDQRGVTVADSGV